MHLVPSSPAVIVQRVKQRSVKFEDVSVSVHASFSFVLECEGTKKSPDLQRKSQKSACVLLIFERKLLNLPPCNLLSLRTIKIFVSVLTKLITNNKVMAEDNLDVSRTIDVNDVHTPDSELTDVIEGVDFEKPVDPMVAQPAAEDISPLCNCRSSKVSCTPPEPVHHAPPATGRSRIGEASLLPPHPPQSRESS